MTSVAAIVFRKGMCEKNWEIFMENMSPSICVFGTYAKGKQGKNKNKFDKTLFLYIICPSATHIVYGNVAQLVEQRPFKAMVPGSNPGVPTILIPKSPFFTRFMEIFLRFTSSYHYSGMKIGSFKFYKIFPFYLLSPPLSIQSS